MLKALKRIYGKVTYRVLLPNGELSEGFESLEGVKQGCAVWFAFRTVY